MGKFLIGLLAVIVVLAGAFWYFSTPSIPRAELEAKYATPPSQFITLADGARAHVRDQGPKDAPLLVLIHGSNASLFTWTPWITRLSDSFRIVTMDMPGHGLTGAVPSGEYSQTAMVEFVKHVTDRMGLPAFALGGNSMGGGIAARFAETYPGRVTHLILVDAGGMPGKAGDKIPMAFKLARMPVLNQIMLHVTPRKLVVEGLNDAIVHKEIITDRMIDQYWDFARMEGTREATMKRFQEGWDTSVADHIAQITAPTLILWGQQDHLIPVEAAHKFAKAIPGSKLVIYPNTGHIPMEEVPDQSAAAVRAFLTPAAMPAEATAETQPAQ